VLPSRSSPWIVWPHHRTSKNRLGQLSAADLVLGASIILAKTLIPPIPPQTRTPVTVLPFSHPLRWPLYHRRILPSFCFVFSFHPYLQPPSRPSRIQPQISPLAKSHAHQRPLSTAATRAPNPSTALPRFDSCHNFPNQAPFVSTVQMTGSDSPQAKRLGVVESL